MAQRIGGIAYTKINGAQYALRGKAEVLPFTKSKTAVTGGDGVHGFTEKPSVPGFNFTITDLGGVAVKDLEDLEGAVITLECNNGKTWILDDAWVEGEITVNQEEGSYDVQFRGMDINEQVA